MKRLNDVADLAVLSEDLFRDIGYGWGAPGAWGHPEYKVPPKPSMVWRNGKWFDTFGSDCSNFACWCYGLNKSPVPGKRKAWMGTDFIYGDAIGANEVWKKLDRPIRGCAVVYPRRGLKPGHIGIITRVVPGDDTQYEVVDCASRIGRAIRFRDSKVFRKNKAIFVAPVGFLP